MAKDLSLLYFELLEKLSEQGVGVGSNVADLLQRYFFNTKEVDITIYNKRVNDIVITLNTMKNNNHIIFDDRAAVNDLMNLFYNGGAIEVSLRKEGLDYYYAEILRNATIQSFENSRTQSTIISNQSKIFKAGAIFAFGSLIVAIITLRIQINQDNTKIQIQKLRQDTTQLRHQLYLLGNKQ
ncbi:hypothetical protein [Mucilaginibacter sp. L196]|uniref:hypothetical protein n=1 Tax=Mucilaginibacter sp. L196 TaxID=1641870 RepID=UPI00131B7432|nr:hypothetical protein [Mucilaginibacter sp. L196]